MALKPKVVETSELIALCKDGETINAHPDQVALWKEQGWQEVAP